MSLKSIVNIERLCCPYSPGYQRVIKTQSVYPTAPSFPSIPPKFLPFPFGSSFSSPQETHPDISPFTSPLLTSSRRMSSCHVSLSYVCHCVMSLCLCHTVIHTCHLVTCQLVMTYCHIYITILIRLQLDNIYVTSLQDCMSENVKTT